MIYLDYAANTPADPRVLDCFVQTSLQYFGNPNGNHKAAAAANAQIEQASELILSLLGAENMEVIATSGASESNNLAIKGAARANRGSGMHIISTCLEHSSVSGALSYLQQCGYEIDLVNILSDGTVDLTHLRELLRKDTVMVSVCYAESELGICQPIGAIGQILQDFPQCIFHVDATQAAGKIDLALADADLVSFAPHKFYGLNGMGVLLRRNSIVLEPLIHGGKSTTLYRSGTPVVSWSASTAKALALCCEEQAKRFHSVETLQDFLRTELSRFPLVHINSPQAALPHFLNLSVSGVKATIFQNALNEHDVCISTKSACSVPNTPSRPVFAVTGDKKLAQCSWRISLSHLTTKEELEQFLTIFDTCYQQLTR
jgi:cysteine desulfurase